MRRLIMLLAILAIGIGVWLTLRDGGLLDRVTESRVEAALIANGAPEELAICMSEKLVDELDISQLRKLEQLAPQEGEDRIPPSIDDALARVRRVDDPQAVRALAQSGSTCSIAILRQRFEEAF